MNSNHKKTSERIGRLDTNKELRRKILPLCRLKYGEVWEDLLRGHRVGVLDATDSDDIEKLMEREKAMLAINDPPYNIKVGGKTSDQLFRTAIDEYIDFSKKWVTNTIKFLKADAHFYAWLGADYRADFQPLANFIIMMREFKELKSRSLITVRKQRGFGTQKGWMWVSQYLLYYLRGNPQFKVVYTEIPKILSGYYKTVGKKLTENIERSKSTTIRPSNVWFDIQQVFYRMEENVPGCYAQKPLKAIDRIILSSSRPNDLVMDLFSHSATTLISGEKLGRKVFTMDIDPIFAELSIRRLEHYRKTGKTGWQWRSPFPEI